MCNTFKPDFYDHPKQFKKKWPFKTGDHLTKNEQFRIIILILSYINKGGMLCFILNSLNCHIFFNCKIKKKDLHTHGLYEWLT